MFFKRKSRQNEELATKKQVGGFTEITRRMMKNKPAMFGLVVISIFILCIVFANFIADYTKVVVAQNTLIRLQPPSLAHLFGTDNYGRDVFARVIYGGRTTLSIAFITTFNSALLGVIFGSLSGFYGGKVDSIIMRIVDTIMCLPPILFSLSVVAALGAGMINLVIAVSITMIPYFTRVVRASILAIVGMSYVEAAHSCGTSDFRIIWRHVIPNAIGPIIVQVTMSLSFIIMLAAGLSYIGLGVQPPRPEWGAMLSEGRDYMRYSPYLVTFPGLAIILSALSLNLLGDGLRDALDPRLRN